MPSLLTYSGEKFSIDSTMCFNVERVTSKSRIFCCEQTPSVPWRILVNGWWSFQLQKCNVWRNFLPPLSVHDEPMTGQENQKRFVLYLYIFHLYLIINKNTDKDMYLVIQERFSSNIWYVTIFCEYPVSLKLLLNILYPYNLFLKYPCIPVIFCANIRYPENP